MLYVLQQNDHINQRLVLTHENKRIQKMLKKHRDVFQDNLPLKLLPERSFKHKIDTENAKSINQNTYSLSQTHLKEQKHQIEDLLKHELICSFSSS